MAKCFIISPIGETGSETRRNADDLRDLIIKPVLEPLGFEVMRGDHRSEAGQIDIDVIRAVQEADLCIADISLPNPNVFYEFGRRDETGKPLILLKAKDSGEMPVDVATRRYIEYDLDSRRGLIDTMEQLRAFVKPIVEKGFESSGNGSSLSELAEILKRVERKIDRLESVGGRPSDGLGKVDGEEVGANPVDAFKLALRQKNIPVAEQAMEQLKYRMETLRWLDQVVEQVAALGSRKSGDIMIENAEYFIDSSQSFKNKLDYLACLVSNLNKTDRELENMELVERICESLNAAYPNEPVGLRVRIYNQLNRVYYGIYATTGEKQWLEKAIEALQKALGMDDTESFLHYNLGLCMEKLGRDNDALEHFMRCIELDGDEQDDDHLEKLCEVLHKLGDPRFSDYFEKLGSINKIKAQLLRSRLK